MKNIAFACICFLMAIAVACSERKQLYGSTLSKPIDGGEWMVKCVDGEEIAVATAFPRLKFNIKEKSVICITPCNQAFFPIDIDTAALTLRFGEGSMTRVFCEDRHIEARLLEDLKTTSKYSQKDSTLILLSENGTELVRLERCP